MIFSLVSGHNRFRLAKYFVAGIISAIAITVLPSDLAAQTNSGNGSITIRSDSQEANSDTGIITAIGNVRINYPARQIQATSAQAQYYSKERKLVLNGSVYVIQSGNSMRAESLTYLIDEARFIASPKTDRQVESTYIVNESVSGVNN